MTYEEQLLNPNWFEKRKAILKRDGNFCQKCFNKSYEKFNQGIIFSKSLLKHNDGFWVQIWDLKNNKILNSKITHDNFLLTMNYICFYENSGNYCNTIALKMLDEKMIELNPIIEIVKQGIKGKVSEKTYTEVYKPSSIDDCWLFALNLHVHHKYYQEGLLAWEYPNEALQTLCWDCHEKLHANSSVPCFDSNGLETAHYNYCKRCYGAGIFPEYSHIQSGICFHCNGAKYEELKK